MPSLILTIYGKPAGDEKVFVDMHVVNLVKIAKRWFIFDLGSDQYDPSSELVRTPDRASFCMRKFL